MPKTISRLSCFGVLFASLLFASNTWAQSTDTQPASPESGENKAAKKADDEESLAAERAGFGRVPEFRFLLPPNTLSVGVRVSGGAKVAFTGVGAITNTSMPTDDLTGNLTRDYSNGFVSPDARQDANGQPIPNDGKTNTWAFASADQVSEDGSGIFMTAYSTISDGSVVQAESGYNPGFDILLSRRMGGNRITWGFEVGLGLSEINAKTTGEVTASLRSLTDFYSLLGAAAPAAPYEGPKFRTDSVTNPDGSTTTVTTDISVLLSELPTQRVDELDVSGAQIDGFWQVKGAYFSTRIGSWMELAINKRFTVRASGGVASKLVGAFLRYDERFELPDDAGELTAINQTETESWGMFGGYAALEGRYWLTERSGFFAGATYEAVSGDVELKAGERAAKMNVESGAGLRLGFTTRF